MSQDVTPALSLIDVRKNFGPTEIIRGLNLDVRPGERHAIIVVHINGKSCGLIVESVSDLVELSADALQPPPALGDAAITAFIEGLAPLDNRMVMVINLAELIGNEVVRVG